MTKQTKEFPTTFPTTRMQATVVMATLADSDIVNISYNNLNKKVIIINNNNNNNNNNNINNNNNLTKQAQNSSLKGLTSTQRLRQTQAHTINFLSSQLLKTLLSVS